MIKLTYTKESVARMQYASMETKRRKREREKHETIKREEGSIA